MSTEEKNTNKLSQGGEAASAEKTAKDELTNQTAGEVGPASTAHSADASSNKSVSATPETMKSIIGEGVAGVGASMKAANEATGKVFETLADNPMADTMANSAVGKIVSNIGPIRAFAEKRMPDNPERARRLAAVMGIYALAAVVSVVLLGIGFVVMPSAFDGSVSSSKGTSSSGKKRRKRKRRSYNDSDTEKLCYCINACPSTRSVSRADACQARCRRRHPGGDPRKANAFAFKRICSQID